MVIFIRNIIFGIDGACFEHIEPLLKRNLLPNFKKLINNGFSSKLKETIPPITVPSWVCLFSGLTPEVLGFYDFYHPDKGLFNSYLWRDKSIFSLVKERIFVLNVPGTYPAWKINGEMIAGMMAPDINCYPPELQFALKKNWIIGGPSIPELFRSFEIKKKLFLRKMKEDFNLMVFVTKIPDYVTHLSKGGERRTLKIIYQVYLKLDKFLGEILNDTSVENIIIFSDHGLKHYKHKFFMRRWLEKKGLLYINNLNRRKLNSIILKFLDLPRTFVDMNFLRKLYPKLVFFMNKKKSEGSKLNTDKYKKTYLRCFSTNVGGIFLLGIDKKKKNLIEMKLKQEKIFKQIITPKLEGFPDYYVILKDKYYFGTQPSFFLKRKCDIFDHSELGFFLAYGNDIKIGRQDLIDYINIAPTLLKLLKIKKPDYMKGEALNIFNQ